MIELPRKEPWSMRNLHLQIQCKEEKIVRIVLTIFSCSVPVSLLIDSKQRRWQSAATKPGCLVSTSANVLGLSG